MHFSQMAGPVRVSRSSRPSVYREGSIVRSDGNRGSHCPSASVHNKATGVASLLEGRNAARKDSVIASSKDAECLLKTASSDLSLPLAASVLQGRHLPYLLSVRQPLRSDRWRQNLRQRFTLQMACNIACAGACQAGAICNQICDCLCFNLFRVVLQL
jgi:hypothetical protein